MKIVLLESLGISQELLDSYVKPLKEKGYEFAAYERNDDPAVQIEEAKDADILIIANMPLKAEVINACPNLKYKSGKQVFTKNKKALCPVLTESTKCPYSSRSLECDLPLFSCFLSASSL